MFKSIFSKYYTVMSLIIITSFLAMGGIHIFFSTHYWVSEKRGTLSESAQLIADHTSQNLLRNPSGDGSYHIYADTMEPFLDILTQLTDASVLILDHEGQVLLCSESDACTHVDQKLTDAVLQELQTTILNGKEYFAVGTLGDLYAHPRYTVGAPILTEQRQVLGYVLSSSSTKEMNAFVGNNFQVFFLSAMGALTLTFIALYAMTYRLVRPLRQMAAATRRFGEGDFSCRIPVKGKDEVAELAAALNSMAVSLSSVEGMRRSFVANVSHELKTPMTTIAGFIDGILDGTIPPEKHKYYLKIVSDEVKRLSRLVKAMLDLSRIDNGELRITPVRFDLTEVTCNALLSFEQRIDSKNIAIEGLEDCPRMEVTGDYDLIGQVVYNLLDNATKFTNEGGYIRITLEKKDGRVFCTIRNSGMGIPPQELPHIFERFYKTDKSRSLDKSGVGLGLYIVKTVINLHHGEIVVRSAEGEYCEFAFWLPDTELPSA